MNRIIIAVLIILVPGMISCVVFTRLRKETMKPWEFIAGTLIFDFFIHLFTFGVMTLMGQGGGLIEELFIYISSTMKFGVISLLAAVAFPVIFVLLSRIQLRKNP